MSASQSNLSSTRYNYDFVVATTQASINATMKLFLSGLTEPVVTVCYVADSAGRPVEADFDDLVKSANGANPFNVPANADPTTDHDLQNLFGARFMMGFRAQIGLPPGLLPGQVPDIVTLGSDTSAVGYNLLCSQFQVVELTPGGYGPPSWLNESQPADTPWIFTSKVDLRLSTVLSTAYSQLPPAVQQQIKTLGPAAFSVQQLLFDLDNAALETVPQITGAPPGTALYTALEQYFVGAYFSQMQKGGTPLLGCSITQAGAPHSTLTLTDLNMEVSPFVGSNGQPIINPTADQQNLATLNYLCAADGAPVPPATPFSWNWIDQPEEADYDGVVAINRTTFANYFRSQMMSYISSNCYLPSARVTLDSLSEPHYSTSLTANQTPQVTLLPIGPVVLTFHHDADSYDQAGLNGDIGQLDLHPSFDASVTFLGNTITVTQHLAIYLRVQHLATSADGNVVDVTVTDTYTIAVNQDGQLISTLATTRQDNSKNPAVNPFLDAFTGLNDLISSIDGWLRNVTSTNLRDIPVSVVQNFVFPGGRTFAFKSAGFSDYGDLTSHITYTDPS